MDVKLTPKQEKFAQKYVELSNASEAYRCAYNVKNSTDKSIWEMASRTLANIKVAARVLQIQAEARERNQVTIESITKELDETRRKAFDENQLSVSYQSTMGKAKLHGLLVDKAENKSRFVDGDGNDLSVRVEIVGNNTDT